MSKFKALSFQVQGVWADGYDKERHSVLALVAAQALRAIMIVLVVPLGIVIVILRPKTAREIVQTWRASRQANKQASAEESTE